MDFTSPDARQRYVELVAAARDSVIAADMDGTLSPIVDDPARATIHPDAADRLADLAPLVRAVAVITGRPARQALALGRLDDVGARIAEAGSELYVFGQYGNERWSSTQRRIISPRPPHGLASFLRELPGLLRRADAADAFVEEKGIAVAVHTRRLADPAGALARLTPLLTDAAERNDLVVEPGRNVVEVRAPGMHKGVAVHTLAEELGVRGFLFAGDDLGDVEAFTAVAELRERGLATLLVCSGSDEEPALVERADVVVDGPDGVMALLARLTDDVRALSAR